MERSSVSNATSQSQGNHTPDGNDAPFALEMRGISKRFAAVQALDDVDFQCVKGEVHALVGENGAGKSTLMKILGGAYRADDGTISLDGEQVSFRHPIEAQHAGVSVIYQEFNLLPHRTVAQNIFIGREPSRFGILDHGALSRRVADLLEELGIAHLVDPDVMAAELSVAQQQLVEIAKAMSFASRILVMDEPTAALSSQEVDVLFELIRSIQERGVTVVYISHRFREVFTIADRVTVLKDGKKVGTRQREELGREELVRMMVGRELEDYYPEKAAPNEIGDVVLEVRGGGNAFLSGIDLKVHQGEILGIAGLQGAGRTELARALFGVDPFETGEVFVGGDRVDIRSPRRAIGLGMGFITEDRKQEGLLLNQSIRDNVVLARRALRALLAPLGTGEDPNRANVADLTEMVDVRAASLQQEVQFLSGGNQQKVVIAKWLATAEDLLIFDEPTRGIDVGAKASIHHLMRDAARDGLAIVMISSELLEVIGMSDRIAVMHEGRIVGELAADASESDIMEMATRHPEEHAESNDVEVRS